MLRAAAYPPTGEAREPDPPSGPRSAGSPQQGTPGMNHNDGRTRVKERIVGETKAYAMIAAYLFLFLGALGVHKALVTGHYEFVPVRLGYTAVEALLLAKIILIGDALHITARFRNAPLIVTTLCAAATFAFFVQVFLLVEHVVTGLFHRVAIGESVREFAAEGPYVIIAHVLLLFAAFVPFFATWELGRQLGDGRLLEMFLRRPPKSRPTV